MTESRAENALNATPRQISAKAPQSHTATAAEIFIRLYYKNPTTRTASRLILALLSDIHANIEALQACLKHARERGADRYAFLGDLVGYGADAQAVVATVMRYARDGALVVKGNHDEAIEQSTPRYMNQAACEAIDWARQTLSRKEKEFLAGLSLSAQEGDVCLVHASAGSPRRWEYVDSIPTALRSMRASPATYTFSGHVHEQLLFAQVSPQRATRYRPMPGSPIPVARHRKWLGLVGSVGQPRDGNPAAAYALFDEAQGRLTYFRVPYDHFAAANKIRAAGLSESLAYRVQKGI